MNWIDILKVDDERWERYLEARRKAKKEGRRSMEKKPIQPRFKCAMCGSKLSIYDRKEHKQNQLNYCSTCKTYRGQNK